MASINVTSDWRVIAAWLAQPGDMPADARAVCAACGGPLVIAGLCSAGMRSRMELDIFVAAASRPGGPEAAVVQACGCVVGHRCAAQWWRAAAAQKAAAEASLRDTLCLDVAVPDALRCPTPACGRPLAAPVCGHAVPGILAPFFARDAPSAGVYRMPALPTLRVGPDDDDVRCGRCLLLRQAATDEAVRRLNALDVWEPSVVDNDLLLIDDMAAAAASAAPVADAPHWGDAAVDSLRARARVVFR